MELIFIYFAITGIISGLISINNVGLTEVRRRRLDNITLICFFFVLLCVIGMNQVGVSQ